MDRSKFSQSKKKLKNEDSFNVQKKLLSISGLWPKRSKSVLEIVLTAWNYITAYLNIALMLHSVFTAKDFQDVVQNFNFFVVFSTYTLKITIFYFNRLKFLDLLDFLQNPIFYSYYGTSEKHLVQAIKTSTVIVRTFQIIEFPTALLVLSIPLLNANSGRELPLDYGLKDMIEEYTVVYITLYVVQVFAGFFISFGNIGLDGILSSLMGLAAGHFKILRETIIQLTKASNENEAATLDNYGKFDEDITEKLKKCVQLHLAIIKFVEMIEEIFTYCFLLQFVNSCLSVCASGLMFLITSPGSFEFLKCLGILLALLFQISLYCVFGDEVIRQSLEVAEACYMTDWVFWGPNVRKTLLIIMERSKRPSKLTAAKFAVLSLLSLVAILRCAYSYGTVLLQFYKE